MKNFLLMLLGKGINETFNDTVKGVFKSECYYDWIKIKNISGSQDGSSEKCLEDLLVASYDKEIEARQHTINNNMHVQQGIITIPADSNEGEGSYNVFLNEIISTSVIFISFINIPSWSLEEKEKIICFNNSDSTSANEVVKENILKIIDKSSMRLFHTFDHNDLAIICNGEKTKLEDYLKILAKIKSIFLTGECFAVHDITTIYGYKSNVNLTDEINAIVSVSGQNVVLNDAANSFEMETIGRYDHISGYKAITWSQLSNMSSGLHGEDIITSRVHIGCEMQQELDDVSFCTKRSSPLFDRFEEIYRNEIETIKFDKLIDIYGGDNKYVALIKLMLCEIGFAICTTLKRGFSKYNSVCYIESYLCFVNFIKEKIIGKYCKMSNDISTKGDDIKKLAQSLVDVSNAFYKSILTLDSSTVHSERRFIMSDPYQLALFDVPPKLIAYYTSIASKMATVLNGNSHNKYVFLITPDIKKDIYVESITRNVDIENEINILVIHINERNIYNVTDTIQIIAHEIAHHVGQDRELRKIRASYFARCYIALLLVNSLDPDIFTDYNTYIDFHAVEKVVDEIVDLIIPHNFTDNENNYYYMDNLQDYIHSTLMKKVIHVGKIDKEIYDILLKYLRVDIVENYLKKNRPSFVERDKIDLSNDLVLKEYTYRLILENTYQKLEHYIHKPEKLKKGVQNIRFIFKEGYADIQMLLLTQNFESNLNEVIRNYSKSFDSVKDKTDEMMRKFVIINTILSKKDQYGDFLDLETITKRPVPEKVYLAYICEQATRYFLKVKERSRKYQESPYNKIFDCSKKSLFKGNQINEIIHQVDNTIASYIESLLT